MNDKVPPPIFTLRGHNVGVTALAYYCDHEDKPYLLSGDQGGDLIIWDLSIFRKVAFYSEVIVSRVQSLRVIKVKTEGNQHNILVVQSRDNGIQLLDLNHAILNQSDNKQPRVLASFPTYESLFSRGDAINVDKGKAILAYPSCLGNYLVTIRVVGSNAETEISGTAQRYKSEAEKTSSVFDILIKKGSHGEGYNLFVAYEDGLLCVFTFGLDSIETVPVLNSTGLKIDLIKKYDLKIGDFISAYDVIDSEIGNFVSVCGSPLGDLIFLTDSLHPNSNPELSRVTLKRHGVSTLSIRPDKKLVAIGGWDTTVKLYSMKSRKLLASLNHHLKQVHDILFIKRPDIHHYSTTGNHSQLDSSKIESEYLLCCASMEGTISISAIY